MMTRGREGVTIPPENDDVIYEQPLTMLQNTISPSVKGMVELTGGTIAQITGTTILESQRLFCVSCECVFVPFLFLQCV